MKLHSAFCLLPFALALTGCAYLRSKTVKEFDPKTGVTREVTVCRAYAIFDSHNQLTKFRNTPGGPTSNAWVGGTSIGAIDQASSSSNLVTIVGDAAAIAKMLHP